MFIFHPYGNENPILSFPRRRESRSHLLRARHFFGWILAFARMTDARLFVHTDLPTRGNLPIPLVMFFDEVAVPAGNLHNDVHGSIRHTLTRQPTVQFCAACIFQLVEFIVGRLVARFDPLLDDDMACRTGTDSAARMIDRGRWRRPRYPECCQATRCDRTECRQDRPQPPCSWA